MKIMFINLQLVLLLFVLLHSAIERVEAVPEATTTDECLEIKFAMLADQYQGIEDKYNALLGPPRKHEKEELVGSMHHYLILKGFSLPPLFRNLISDNVKMNNLESYIDDAIKDIFNDIHLATVYFGKKEELRKLVLKYHNVGVIVGAVSETLDQYQKLRFALAEGNFKKNIWPEIRKRFFEIENELVLTSSTMDDMDSSDTKENRMTTIAEIDEIIDKGEETIHDLFNQPSRFHEFVVVDD